MNVLDQIRERLHNYSSILRSKKKKNSETEGSKLLCNTGSVELPLHVPLLKFFIFYLSILLVLS